ncbi:hypothetical protein [Shewanella aestuarii]|uniref:hypothetical protein n=1 Tax=Shewanella aestuarii TaxID=1028752 RepID=UPI001ABF6476|nr:hypothetical protein [Shewanella aestuarii]
MTVIERWGVGGTLTIGGALVSGVSVFESSPVQADNVLNIVIINMVLTFRVAFLVKT